MVVLAVALLGLALIVFIILVFLRSSPSTSTSLLPSPSHKRVPLAVNYHFSRRCNYKCGFCFHTYTNDFNLSLEDAYKGLRLLADAGMKKINFAGGEPFLFPKELGAMIRFCKTELHLESVSIVSNGSRLSTTWFDSYGRYIDILAISCDSFDEEVNKKIGRSEGGEKKATQVKNVWKARNLCDKHGIKFKINTVVNAFNWEEDMSDELEKLAPSRWKVFQVLVLKTENDGGSSKRDATEFLVSDAQFKAFLDRHSHIKSLVPEDNKTMVNSYLILDERMRFLNCENGAKQPSQSLLDVGVEKALEQSGFDSQMFDKRGGKYDWTRESLMENYFDSAMGNSDNACTSLPNELKW